MSQSNEPQFDIDVQPPAPAREGSVNLASIGAASAAAPQPKMDGEGVESSQQAPQPAPATESKPLVSGRAGAVLGIISLMAAAGAGFTTGTVQGVLVVLAMLSGLAVGKFAVDVPAFAAGRPLVSGSWALLATAGAGHLGTLANVLPPGLGASLAVAGGALCCLLAGLPFSRPVKR